MNFVFTAWVVRGRWVGFGPSIPAFASSVSFILTLELERLNYSHCTTGPLFCSHIISSPLAKFMASFEHLFTTNEAPTDEESIKLKQYVAGWDDKLNIITQKISALEEQLRGLKEE